MCLSQFCCTSSGIFSVGAKANCEPLLGVILSISVATVAATSML